MPEPLVSIVLPTYNGARYLRQSIESCLQQTFTDFELIIVNDCSTDATPEIAEAYAAKDPRVIVLHNEFNRKLPLSLNTGFNRARGRYFTWTSDDNLYAPGALEFLVRSLEENPGADLVYTDYHLIDEEGRQTGIRRFGDIRDGFASWPGCGACFLYKREIHIANKGYNPAAFLIEDYDFFVRAYMQFNFLYRPNADLYYYREHSQSLTATQNSAINEISKIFLERNLPGLEQKLPRSDSALLYRKLAVYFAVQKNHRAKYRHYLILLQEVSVSKALVTVLYVLFIKCAYALVVGFSGLFYFIRNLFK